MTESEKKMWLDGEDGLKPYLRLKDKGMPKGKIEQIAWLLLNGSGCGFCKVCRSEPCNMENGTGCTNNIADYIRKTVLEESESEIQQYWSIGTVEELKELKESNLSGLELAAIAIAIIELKEYEDLEKQGKLLKLPCNVGDTVFDVVLCDDEKYHIFPMRVCNINPFGDVRKGKVWNIYLESKYTKAYRSFYDFGKTIFTTRSEAEEALKKMEEKKAHAEEKEQPETE